MTTEIEVKVLDISKTDIEEKIEKLGAVLQGDWLMETIIFDYPDGRLLQNGSYIRIRNEGKDTKCTYKTPVQNNIGGEVKVMQEHEVVVSSLSAMKEILLGLGLVPVTHFEKKRKHYTMDDIVFDVDTLPCIPTYLEIEAPSVSRLHEILNMLSIPVEKTCSMGPKEVLAHYGLDIDELSEMKF